MVKERHGVIKLSMKTEYLRWLKMFIVNNYNILNELNQVFFIFLPFVTIKC